MSQKKGPRGSRNKNSFVGGLKTEWNLFWETIIGDDEIPDGEVPPLSKDPFVTGKIETLTMDQVKAITKALSSDRRKLNQRLESLAKEIDENTRRLESLNLVGGETEETRLAIHELSDLGQDVSEKLNRINERLKKARETEDQLKRGRDL